LRYLLADVYQNLEVYCNILPFNANPATRPFTGVVLNFRVSTSGHRDKIDKVICVLIPFGKWEGGELCLYELGLVLKLQPGDVFIFKSCDITHFNLHFSGIRGSIVLHSDKEGDSWVENRNDWEQHMM
jgi:hypothetical protein